MQQYRELPEEERRKIREYCVQDVDVLHEVHEKFKSVFTEMLRALVGRSPKLVELIGDGESLWKPTFAATSLAAWKSFLFPPFLDLQPELNARLYAIVKSSYFGGITAVFDHRRHLADGVNEKILYYDINSLYPSCMTGPFPTTAGSLSLLENMDCETRLTLRNVCQDDLYAVSYFDHKGLYMCFIPRRTKGATLYPDREDLLAGKGLRDERTGEIQDLEQLPPWIDTTCVWVWGLTIAAALTYQPTAVFKAVAKITYPVQHRIFKRISEFYDLRLQNLDTSLNPILKLSMNSVYGKMAQNQFDVTMYTSFSNLPFDPSKAWLKQGDEWTASAEKVLWEAWLATQHPDEELRKEISPEVMNFPPVKKIRFLRKLNFVEVVLNTNKEARISNTQGLAAIASKITAMARNQFVSMVHDARRAGFVPLYGDTDSLVIKGRQNTPVPWGNAPRVVWRQPWARDPHARGGVAGVSNRLGELKLEHELCEF